MSHSFKAQRAEQKRQPVEYDDDAYTESLLASLRSGKEEPDQREENQGASDGRNTEN